MLVVVSVDFWEPSLVVDRYSGVNTIAHWERRLAGPGEHFPWTDDGGSQLIQGFGDIFCW